MLEYCPNCKCKIRFYKAHECDKMKHELADAVKLAGDVIASSDDCKVKENTAHGIFRIWCVLRNTIEIICDIIKRLRCVQKKSQKVCEAQHCLANRIDEVNKMIGAVNEGIANTPNPAVQAWEAERDKLNGDYNRQLQAYNRARDDHNRQNQAYLNANSDYSRRLQAYNQRKADYERRKREYEAGQGQGGGTQWQTAWGHFQRSGAPLDVVMGGSPNSSLHGINLSGAKAGGYGKGIGFTAKNDNATIIEIELSLLGYSYNADTGQGELGGHYVQYGGTYDWEWDIFASTDGGNSYQPVEQGVSLAKHPDTGNLAYQSNWHLSSIKWNKTYTNLPPNFTHLKTEIRGAVAGQHHQNVYAREQIVRRPFPPFTEQPPTNNAQPPKPFTGQPPKQPVIPPKPDNKVNLIPTIKGGCELMDCNFDCFFEESATKPVEPVKPVDPSIYEEDLSMYFMGDLQPYYKDNVLVNYTLRTYSDDNNTQLIITTLLTNKGYIEIEFTKGDRNYTVSYIDPIGTKHVIALPVRQTTTHNEI